MNDRFNEYRTLWTMVLFDLPVLTKKDRKEYTRFRKSLIKDGFHIFQFSIYMRHSFSKENAEVHKRRVRMNLPPKGKIGILNITDKQFGMMEVYYGEARVDAEKPPQQLEMF
jgi:CRISPR-associated protein Cas2